MKSPEGLIWNTPGRRKQFRRQDYIYLEEMTLDEKEFLESLGDILAERVVRPRLSLVKQREASPQSY